ncbi:MAG: hypothetical protein ACRERR_03515 [Moraxellaceae bacterium]
MKHRHGMHVASLSRWIACGLLSLLAAPVLADNYLRHADPSADGWDVSVRAETYAWALDGNVVNEGKSPSNISSSFAATGDSLNFSAEVIPQLSVIASNRQWSFGAHYLPLHYEGSGYGLAGLVSSSVGGFASAAVDAGIDIDFLLAEGWYNLIATDSSLLSVGVGLGKIDVGMDFAVGGGARFNYDAESPFGYMSVKMVNRVDRFFYGAIIGGMLFNNDDVNANETDYRLSFGWRLVQGKTPVDIDAGWRQMQLSLDIDSVDSHNSVNLDLKGPYLGVMATF